MMIASVLQKTIVQAAPVFVAISLLSQITPVWAGNDYVGVTYRPDFTNDPGKVGFTAKLSLINLSVVSISTRPTILLGDYTELRLPATVEYNLGNIRPYLGIGVATNVDQKPVSPYLTGGLDINLYKNLVLNLGVNHVIKNNSDTEILLGVGIKF